MPRSGVSYDPLLDWLLAAQWWHYRWEEFCELDGDEQALLVAVYRTHGQIEGVIHKDAMRKVKA